MTVTMTTMLLLQFDAVAAGVGDATGESFLLDAAAFWV